MHTPRLCIDGRVASELSFRGLIAQEVIDQLVTANGEPDSSSEWIEKQRTVLLVHPKQVFTGQLRRFDTKKKIGRSPLYWVWEKNFVKNSNISAFHRFRPVDWLNPSPACPTITTLLPAKSGLPFFLSRRPNQHFVVPSEVEMRLLEKNYQIEPQQIHLVVPTVRRYVHFVDPLRHSQDGHILFLVGDAKEEKQLKKLVGLVSDRFPNLPRKVLRLKNNTNLSPMAWMKILQNTKLCFYLTSQTFDWPTLALEAMYWNIPTLFCDGHHSLNELLPGSPFRLSNFLVEQKELKELERLLLLSRLHLRDQGIFDSLGMARQYSQIYRCLPVTHSIPDAAPEPSPCQS